MAKDEAAVGLYPSMANWTRRRMLEKPVYSWRGHVPFRYAERSICFSSGEFPRFLDCFAYWYSLTRRVPLRSVTDPTGSLEGLDMSQEATRKQQESHKPREAENPNGTPRKDTQEENRNPGQDPDNPSNNPTGDPQRRQERSRTTLNDRNQQDDSRDATNRQAGQTEKQNNQNRKDSNPSQEDNKNPGGEKEHRSQTDDQPSR